MPPRDRRSNDDSGTTLIELLITLVLMATAAVAVFSSWQFGIESSDKHRSQAEVQTVLSSASERVVAATGVPDCAPAYVPPTPPNPPVAVIPTNAGDIQAYYQTEARKAQLPSGSGWTANAITVAPVDFWNGREAEPIWSAACYQSVGVNLTRVTITVRHPDGKATGTLQVVVPDA